MYARVPIYVFCLFFSDTHPEQHVHCLNGCVVHVQVLSKVGPLFTAVLPAEAATPSTLLLALHQAPPSPLGADVTITPTFAPTPKPPGTPVLPLDLLALCRVVFLPLQRSLAPPSPPVPAVAAALNSAPLALAPPPAPISAAAGLLSAPSVGSREMETDLRAALHGLQQWQGLAPNANQ